MSDKSLEEMSSDELLVLLTSENRLYLKACSSLIKNGSRKVAPENIEDFRRLTEEYVNRTEPIRKELYQR